MIWVTVIFMCGVVGFGAFMLMRRRWRREEEAAQRQREEDLRVFRRRLEMKQPAGTARGDASIAIGSDARAVHRGPGGTTVRSPQPIGRPASQPDSGFDYSTIAAITMFSSASCDSSSPSSSDSGSSSCGGSE